MHERKPGTSGNRFTDTRKEIYLAELRRTGLKLDSRIAANVCGNTITRHRKKYPKFAQAEEAALVSYLRLIEDEIHRRAITGVKRPITVAGDREIISEFSDALLVRLAKRHIPEYRDQVTIDQKTEHSGVLALEADLSKLDDHGRHLLRQLLQCKINVSEEETESE